MKHWMKILMLGAALGFCHEAIANPFSASYVCVPKIDPAESNLEFRIREGGQCSAEETLMVVQTGPNGSTLLYPSAPPLSQEAKGDLENYKKYMGIH